MTTPTTPVLTAEQKAKVLAEALPYIRAFHAKTLVIKYGGNAMIDPALKADFGRDIALLQLVGMKVVVVHGGGPQIDHTLERVGIRSEFRRGMRVTDEATLNVVEMVLSELNQEIVSLVNRHGGKAVGLDGQDGRFILARRMLLSAFGTGDDNSDVDTDLGFVGDVERIDPEIIHLLHSRGFIPVVMPIGVGADGVAYNINADVVAGSLAETLQAEKLIVLTNTPGVLDREGRLLASLAAADIEMLGAEGTIHGGMLPKLASALHAVRHGVRSAHIIDGRVPGALLLEVLTSEGVGTMIRSNRGANFLADSEQYLAP